MAGEDNDILIGDFLLLLGNRLLLFLFDVGDGDALGSQLIDRRRTVGGFDIRRQMIGSGPFYLKRYEPSVSYTLGSNLENLVLLTGATTGTGNGSVNSITGNSAANLSTTSDLWTFPRIVASITAIDGSVLLLTR